MAEATSPLREYARRVKVEPTIVTVRGKPVAALVSLEGVDEESLAVSTNPEFIQIIRHSRKRLKKEGGIPADEVRRLVGVPAAKRRGPR